MLHWHALGEGFSLAFLTRYIFTVECAFLKLSVTSSDYFNFARPWEGPRWLTASGVAVMSCDAARVNCHSMRDLGVQI